MTGGGPETAETPDVWGAEDLAVRMGDLMGDLVRSIDAVDDRLVRAEGIPELLDEALDALHDVVGLDEMWAISVVDHTDAGQGLELVHHATRHTGGAVLELRTPLAGEGEGEDRPGGAPSATKHWRSADWLEREAWELSGLVFEDHPHLERLLLPRWWTGHPLRRDGARQRTVSPTEATVTPGREHPGEHWWDVDLPPAPMGGTMGLRVRGKEGVVTGAVATVGMSHRGIEGLAEGRRFWEVPVIMARAAPRSSVHWQVALSEAVEALCRVEVPPRGRALRVALMELERIADHMLSHASTLELLGCRAAAARVWTDRELVMDVGQVVTGQRLVQDAVVLGGVARDAHESWSDRLGSVARMVHGAVREYVHEAEALDPLNRLEGLATVHLEDMRGWGLSGPLLRAAGVPRDARTDGRCRAYEDFPVSVQTRRAGDAMARSELRLLEMASSAGTLEGIADAMPGGRVRAARPQVFPEGAGWGVAEGPRGEVACMVVSDGTDRPRRVKMRSPDLAHAAALVDLLLGCPEADVALAVASVDICVGGVDR